MENKSPPPVSAAYKSFELYTPKFVTAIRQGYSRQQIQQDMMAGLTVAIVALPLAMALAIASGASPEKGLITVIVGGLLISLLGGSRFQIGGPTGAFVVVVFNVIQIHGYDGLILATGMAGFMLILAGAFRLGTYVKYIPQPVVIGFTAGIGLIIFSSQVNDFLGLSLTQVPADFLPKWKAYLQAAPSISLTTALFSVGCLAAILGIRRYLPRFPAFLTVVILAAVSVWAFNLNIDTIGHRFGGIPHSIPMPILPEISWERLSSLLPSAFTIAFLAGVESLLSAVVADGMTGRRHRSNCELIAQGVANIASAAFTGLPATGAIARTATNIRSGAFSPLSGIFHALFVLLFMLTLAPLASYIPMPVLAAILMVVAWNMSEVHRVKNILGGPRGDALVFVLTFGLTVLVDLTVAIEVGVVLAAVLFTHRMANAVEVETSDHLITEDISDEEADRQFLLSGTQTATKDIQIYRISGPFFFGAATKLMDVLDRTGGFPKVIILCLHDVPFMDSTGATALDDFFKSCARRHQSKVIVCGAQAPILRTLKAASKKTYMSNVSFSSKLKTALSVADTHIFQNRDEA